MGPEATFLDHLRAGRLMIQRAPDGAAVFPPRVCAPGTGAPLDWRPAAGTGRVHAVTVEHRKGQPPRALVLVELDDGVRMLSRMPEADQEAIAIGDRVRARIVAEEPPHVVFVHD